MKLRALAAAVLLLTALPALAQSPSLRGTQSAATDGSSRSSPPAAGAVANGQTSAPAGATAALARPPLPLAPPSQPQLMSPADQAAAQCSAACSRDYYFCLAGDNADLCATSWGQCRATCDITARRTVR